jgi:PAS domain S-box-containing protein
LLQQRTGHDFGRYKQGTLLRRIRRRIQLRLVSSVAEYLSCLKRDAEEPEALLKDLLIGVTQFFRDPEAFEVLSKEIVPSLFEGKPADAAVRVWVAGCASGEEAYSIAILLHEHLARQNKTHPVQIFATDIDTESLAQARQGHYREEIREQLSPERLKRYFVSQGGSFQVAQELREMCIFSSHSLIRDPPFSSLDLVSCRNVLIYLEPDLQRKLIPLLHYALRPDGVLFLGPSEGLSAYPELFRAVNNKQRIFRRNETLVRPKLEFPFSGPHVNSASRQPASPNASAHSAELVMSQAIERVILAEYAPACAVINERGEILYTAGRTGLYLQAPPGGPTHDIFQMAEGPLGLELRAALFTTAKRARKVVRHDVPVDVDGRQCRLRLTVRPLPGVAPEARLFMVILQETAAPPDDIQTPEELSVSDDMPIVEQLTNELRAARSELDSTVERLASANEELRSSNEELVSTNEELQSTNEELQTSRQELQSVNEELEAVNAELHTNLRELTTAHIDQQNLFAATQIATVFLDDQLRLTKFTPSAASLLHLSDSDLGQTLPDLAIRFGSDHLLPDVGEVLRTGNPVERSVHTAEGLWFAKRVLPYRTADDAIAGAVITLVDVTALKHAEAGLSESQQQQKFLADILERSSQPFGVGYADGRLGLTNRAFEQLTGYSKEELQSIDWANTLTPPEFREIEQQKLDELRRTGSPVRYEKEYVRKDGTRVPIELLVHLATDSEGAPQYYYSFLTDITERKRAEAELCDANDRLRWVLSTITDSYVVYSRDWRLLAINPLAEASIFKRPAGEILGKVIWDEYPSAQNSSIHEHYARAFEGNHPVHFETQSHVSNGWFEVHAYPRGDRLEVYSRDITERKLAEQALSQAEARASRRAAELTAVFDTITFPVIAFDAQGTPVNVNAAGKAVLGLEPNTLNFEQWVNLIIRERGARHLDGRPLLPEELPVFQALRGETVKRRTMVVRDAQGREGIYEASASPLQEDRGIVGAVVVWLDVTTLKLAERELQASEEQFRAIASNTPDHLLIQDLDLRYTLIINPQLGLTEQDMLGKTDYDFLDPGNAEKLTAIKRKVLETGEPAHLESPLVAANGEQQFFEGSYVPKFNSAGQIDGLIGYFKNVTERKSAEQRQRELYELSERRAAEVDAIVDALPHAVYFGDEHGISRCNAQALRMLGATSVEDLRQRINELGAKFRVRYRPDGGLVEPENLPFVRALNGEVAVLDTWATQADSGQDVLIRGNAAPVRVGDKTIGAVAVNIDITDQYRANESLREADQRKNEFLAMLSHELRNPLTPISISLFILERAVPGSEQANRARAVIARQVGQLRRLVDDLLDITRISLGKLNLRRARFDLAQMVNRSADDHRAMFVDAGIAFNVRAVAQPLWVDGDEARMAQVVGNLLNNSAKFTPKDGTVLLELEEVTTDGMAVLRVRDTGAGVAPAMLPKLFDPFIQADESLDRSKGGLGLGLALVKGIVEMHGGLVEAHSDGLGTGAEFVLRLPAELGTADVTLVKKPSDRPAPRRVLVIEDNVDAAESLRDALEFGEHQVEVAHDGIDGLAKARKFKPDVVLCDIGLPGMTGYDVARAFRGDEVLGRAHLVALTGYALPNDQQQAREAGFEQHLAKPPSLEDLDELLANLPL